MARAAGPARQQVRDDPRARRVLSLSQRFALLLLASLLCQQLPLPWRMAGAAFALAGAVVGVQALRATAALRRDGVRLGSVPLVAVGLGLAVVTLLGYASQVALYPLVSEREECMRGALTRQAERACEARFTERVEQLQQRLEGRLSAPRTAPAPAL